jgi:hypothetical protein
MLLGSTPKIGSPAASSDGFQLAGAGHLWRWTVLHLGEFTPVLQATTCMARAEHGKCCLECTVHRILPEEVTTVGGAEQAGGKGVVLFCAALGEGVRA